ncbi:hypothetical protein HPP92_008137 [Vanilla planifolia]|uniref:Uncharacterized protein n=1 Tax=Vanilla planifolia TaxID=51239 RepID=A0A835RHG9_VANPL|nr:hypothetical protein HPP92_008137 [Vanilla planifolia]
MSPKSRRDLNIVVWVLSLKLQFSWGTQPQAIVSCEASNSIEAIVTSKCDSQSSFSSLFNQKLDEKSLCLKVKAQAEINVLHIREDNLPLYLQENFLSLRIACYPPEKGNLSVQIPDLWTLPGFMHRAVVEDILSG